MTKIIAEIGQNHMGNVDNLNKMVDQLISSSVDIIKFQYWEVGKIYREKDIRYKKALDRAIDNNTLIEAIKRVQKNGKVVMLSTFPTTDFEENAKLHVLTKYASSEYSEFIKNLEYHNKASVAAFVSLGYQKPTLPANAANAVYLTCNPKYPDYNPGSALQNMVLLHAQGYACGFSDHSIGLTAAKAAILLKADVIEKHFTLSDLRSKSTFRDHKGSMTVKELNELCCFRDDYITNRDDQDFVLKDKDGFRRLKEI